MRTDLDFGPYQPLFLIGAGGMGEVYAARAKGQSEDKLVAVKRLFPRFGGDPRFVAMFVDEARIMSCVSHPSVVRILDVGSDRDGVPYLAMEMVVGADLTSLLDKLETLPVNAALTWIAEAAEGLHAAHEARGSDGQPLSLVHRDVSPENVLVGIDGRARILDFGIAKATGRLQQSTATGDLKGKLAYMSPEQTLGAVLDRRSDVFSLGAVAWEALVGDSLFKAQNAPDTLDRVRSGPVVPPHVRRPEVPRAASEAIMRALSRAPEQRFQTALELANAIRATLPSTAPDELAAIVSNAGVVQLNQVRTGLERTWPQAAALLGVTAIASDVSVRHSPLRRWAKPAFVVTLGLLALLALLQC